MPTPFRLHLTWLCCGLLLAGVAAGRAALAPPADWKLPPIDGELSGEFNAVFLGGAPKLKWKLTARTPKPRERALEFAIEGYGFRLRGDAQVDPMGEGSWRMIDAEIDLREWVGWVAPHLSAELATMTFGGMLTAKGEGTWRGGALAGRATLALRDGLIESTKRKVRLEGVACELTLEDLARPRTAPAQVLTWTGGHYDVVPLGAGRIEFALDGDTVNLARAIIAVLGGEIAVTGVTFSTQRPEFTASAQVMGVDVGQLVFLFPRLLARASGQLDGYVDLTRDAQGIAIGAGYLGLREGENAELQLNPTPGVISSALPPAINKLYPGIAKVETEGIPMKADELQMRFIPERDELGRTAWIHVAGRPVDPGFKGPIDLMVNVHGPLDQVLNSGADFGLHMMGATK